MTVLCVGLESWAGCTFHPVTILKETPKRFKVRWLDKSMFRFVQGEEFYVPKSAVTEINREQLLDSRKDLNEILEAGDDV